MLEETGVFDESFFLYCETPIWACARALGGLEMLVRAGRCSRAPVFSFSGSRIRSEGVLRGEEQAGRSLEELPATLLWRVPFVEAARYFWHVVFILRGQGAASEFQETLLR